MPPVFSIALCTFNGQRYLPAQLDSFLAQTRPPDELIVCDDGSTDDTPRLVEAYAAQAPFPVRFHRNAVNLGVVQNFGQAIDRCQGDWIFLSDQDDLWMPEKLARFDEAMAAIPSADFGPAIVTWSTPRAKARAIVFGEPACSPRRFGHATSRAIPSAFNFPPTGFAAPPAPFMRR